MRESERKDIASQLKRYLSSRRSVWGDIAFRLQHRAEDRVDGTIADENVQAGSKFLETKAEGVKAAGKEAMESEMKAADRAQAASHDEQPNIERRSMGSNEDYEKRLQGKSIRYRTPSTSFEQASLFDDSAARGDTFDLSGEDLDSLAKRVAECRRCPLWEERTRTVFSNGSKRARLMFVGEAPGREEDLQGLPFVGRAGKLLTKILDSVGLARDEVYITNILKCRPPNNRDPNEEEVRACEPYLARQIELLKPVLICALGRVAAQNLLKTNASLSVLRGGIHYYNDTRVIVTYHPAALLRNPHLKRSAWEDIKLVRKIYDEEIAEEE